MINGNFNVMFHALLFLFLFKGCDNVLENYLIFLNQDCLFL